MFPGRKGKQAKQPSIRLRSFATFISQRAHTVECSITYNLTVTDDGSGYETSY